MGILSNVVFAVIFSFLLFRHGNGDELNASPTAKWSCLCASEILNQSNYSETSNCSTSCSCTRGHDEGWTCLCESAGTPQIPGVQGSNCFNACNCTYGSSKARKEQSSSKLVVVILLLCVVLTVIAFLASLACYFYRKDRSHSQPKISSSNKSNSLSNGTKVLNNQSDKLPSFHIDVDSHINRNAGFMYKLSSLFRSKPMKFHGVIIQFSYYELEQATNNFSKDNVIGVGGNSKVFLGHLNDGKLVAIKRLSMSGGSNMECGFLSEVELLSRLNHCHVVPLLGYCLEIQGKKVRRVLVSEYMTNGSLRDCLNAKAHAKEAMNWKRRVSIALGAARGLEYLHEAAAPRILHRDVKSTNILIDDMYVPKITDLGMAKRLTPDDIISCTNSPARMMGTFGYFAPEYAIIGKASLKSDVFSFGVVILELMTGRQPIQKATNMDDESLVLWATPRLLDSKSVIQELADPLLTGCFPKEEMQIMAHLARECLQWDPDSRPTMSEVVQILSIISPDKSKRRNFSVNLLSGSLPQSIKSNSEMERVEEICIHTDEREAGQIQLERPQTSGSFQLSLDTNKRERTFLSARRLQNSEDEMVDLIEPRFESF